jgi:hypothetical protein
MESEKEPILIRQHAATPEASEITNCTVAFLDILGFKNKIENIPLAELAGKYERLIIQTDASNRPFMEFPGQPKLFPNHAVGVPYCQRFIFSDSIILISHDNSFESCLMLIVYCWRLMQTMLASGFPPRGAISYGEMYINPSQNVFLGTAITEAAKLEKIQEWVGTCLHPSIIEQFPEILSLVPLIKPYDVPIKDENPRNLYTINWRLGLIVQKGTKSLFNPVVLQKNANALAYALHSVNQGAYLNDQVAPIELRSFFIGDREPIWPHGDEY